jgi:RNase P protein component
MVLIIIGAVIWAGQANRRQRQQRRCREAIRPGQPALTVGMGYVSSAGDDFGG